MNLVNRIVTRNATLWAYVATAAGFIVDVWLPTHQTESRWLTIGGVVLTVVVNVVRALREENS